MALWAGPVVYLPLSARQQSDKHRGEGSVNRPSGEGLGSTSTGRGHWAAAANAESRLRPIVGTYGRSQQESSSKCVSATVPSTSTWGLCLLPFTGHHPPCSRGPLCTNHPDASRGSGTDCKADHTQAPMLPWAGGWTHRAICLLPAGALEAPSKGDEGGERKRSPGSCQPGSQNCKYQGPGWGS